MARKFRISIDIDLDPALNVILYDGIRFMFKKFSGGPFYYDTTNMEHNTINIQINYYTFLNTVYSNKAYFHQREIKG